MLCLKLNYREVALTQIGRFYRLCAQQHLRLRSQESDVQLQTVE